MLYRAVSMEPDSLQVHVSGGVVDIAGRLEHRGLVPLLIELVRGMAAWSMSTRT